MVLERGKKKKRKRMKGREGFEEFIFLLNTKSFTCIGEILKNILAKILVSLGNFKSFTCSYDTLIILYNIALSNNVEDSFIFLSLFHHPKSPSFIPLQSCNQTLKVTQS